jgi:hypothetical protein
LQRTGDVEQLDAREGEDFDAPGGVWRNSWGLCHFRHFGADYYPCDPRFSMGGATMTIEIGLLVFPRVRQLDLTGP